MKTMRRVSDKLQFVVDFPDGLVSRRHDKTKSVLRVGSTAKQLCCFAVGGRR